MSNLQVAPERFQKITHVAVVRNGVAYSLPAPNRHHNVLWSMPPKVRDADDETESRDVQGFLLEDGTFVDRKEAYIIATGTGQINRRQYPGSYQGDQLFSEDLW